MSKFKTVSSANPARRVLTDGLLKVNSVDENKNYKVFGGGNCERIF